MRKRLIATLVAAGSLLLVTAVPANAQDAGTADPLCANGDNALIPLRVDLGPLAVVTVRLLCVDEEE